MLKAARLSDLVELGSLTPAAAAFLEASVRAGLNVLVAGGTQAGKTTLLDCLAAAIPGGDRVVSAEEVFELTKAYQVIDVCPAIGRRRLPPSDGSATVECEVRTVVLSPLV